ncbi:hypothetical protein EJ05DRAFT_446212 [Pseudovirgaria hyperparasitica]|uniref:protein-tyrosine-phosphatase n=1 Tax=Pseudovirgaria hyperparasitica TaxID=470096 RepID=A0A6A6VU44_9PEZI|nr:uncharacterized protein EJ05DRAFT_446212 [Pseudovirgaria hyperparasitica]KAF2752767.1 hypothetical protein EJ05DRAFT_446212 [Pseudovirgaria hyperparasitica]
MTDFSGGLSKHGEHLSRGNTTRLDNSATPPFSTFHHQHRDSTSTSASDSTDSSPTTTISTVDSASMTDPSPGPSPESPAGKHSSSSFVPDLRSRHMPSNGDTVQTPFFELQRPMTPAKKPRNLKGLAVNTSSALSLNRPATSGHVSTVARHEAATSAPASPSFVKPPTPPRRMKPAALALSLQTPANTGLPTRLAIPPTPSFQRVPSLRHFQSSPQLPLMSPSIAPDGGMQFPPLRPFKPSPHGFAEVPIENEEEEQEPNFDIPQSREEKPASYPNGPICIYESGVYLYYEPTAEQASKYDVILNVASEVKNPFSATIDEAQRASNLVMDEYRCQSEPVSSVGPIAADFTILGLAGATAKDDGKAEQSNTPTTPKASEANLSDSLLRLPEVISRPLTSNRPEYIHIPWEHNTDLVPDLYKLVKIIEDRVQRRKHVLVHCQCGVSRSATLIVAYGLYKNPGISVQEAYDAVKKRSKWIGPNMNLIMQLQEFRNGLIRANTDRAFHQQIFGSSLRAFSPVFRKNSPFPREEAPASGSRTPRTAPLPPDIGLETLSQRASTGNMEAISPGPLTAPSNLWSPGFRHSWNSSSPTAYTSNPIESATGPSAEAQFSTPLPGGDNDNRQAKEPSLGSQVVVVQPPPRQSYINGRSPPRVPNFSRPVLHLPLNENDETSGVSPPPAPMFSPRSEEFHMVSVSRQEPEDAFGILSPVTTFTRHAEHSNQSRTPARSDPSYHLMSPGINGAFPVDPFGRREEPDSTNICSPRATEFHMTALKHTAPHVDDSFGLTSPRNGDFRPVKIEASTSFYNRNQSKREPRTDLPQRVHSLSPSQSSGVIQAAAGYQYPDINHYMDVSIDPRNPRSKFESVSSTPTSKQTHPSPSSELPGTRSEPQSEYSRNANRLSGFHFPLLPPIPQDKTPLQAPSNKRKLRTRFSSPNLSQQIKIHKIQTEIEARLPNRSAQAQDDLDALMSPRATEFTKNPFHEDLRAKVEPIGQIPPAVHGFSVPELSDLKKDDPRSPAHKGSSPIVRNIWDVL